MGAQLYAGEAACAPGARPPACNLQRLVGQGLAVALPDDALLEVMRLAVQADLALRLSLRHRGVEGRWAGRLQRVGWLNGQVLAQGAGVQLQWGEGLPGQQAWLLREPGARGLLQSLVLLSADGEPGLRLSSPGAAGTGVTGSRGEPCAWRSAIESVCGGRAGMAC